MTTLQKVLSIILFSGVLLGIWSALFEGIAMTRLKKVEESKKMKAFHWILYFILCYSQLNFDLSIPQIIFFDGLVAFLLVFTVYE